jgi:hypothetical protein
MKAVLSMRDASLGCKCERFRMTAPSETMPRAPGPSSESLQGRNPREVGVGRCRALWGFDGGTAGRQSPSADAQYDPLLRCRK